MIMYEELVQNCTESVRCALVLVTVVLEEEIADERIFSHPAFIVVDQEF